MHYVIARVGEWTPEKAFPCFILVALAVAIVWLLSALSDEKRRQQRLRETEAKRHEEEESQRRWNSPEAIEQRRIEAERYRAEVEEKERQRKALEENLARDKWARYYRWVRIEEVDEMTGTEFENFLGKLFERLGHKDVRRTPASGDQGADLISLSPDSKRTVVQAKCWKGPVGNSAIQEVMGALAFYDAEIAFVVTNRSFTDSALALARKDPRIHLVDRTDLAELMRTVLPRDVPEFDWEKYNLCVAGWEEKVPRYATRGQRRETRSHPAKRKRGYKSRYRHRRW
jgi:restriction endonuclease Mrr